MENTEESRLRELVRLLERKMGLLNEGEMRCCHISLAQCHTLVEIGRAGALSLNALAALLDLDNSTMSRTVQNLVVSGLARREPDPADRRAVRIALTPQGEALFSQIEDGMARQYRAVLERIPPERRDQVLESLSLLADAMRDCC